MEMYELRLIRCFLGGHRDLGASTSVGGKGAEFTAEDEKLSDRAQNFQEGLREVVNLVENGSYAEALGSKWMSSLLGDFREVNISGGNTRHAARKFYEFVETKTCANCEGKGEVVGSAGDAELELRAILVLALGVAALSAFIQANMTGPTQHKFPSAPLQGIWTSNGVNVGYHEKEWESWARLQLMTDGCELIGKVDLPQYLILAKLLLVSPAEVTVKTTEAKRCRPKTWSWWALRTLTLQQRILAERSASLLTSLSSFSKKTCEWFGTYEAVQELGWDLRPQEAKTIAAAVCLETGFMAHLYGHNDVAREFFDKAGGACGLELEITGVLGYRTKYQTDAKAQMVLVTKTVHPEPDTWMDFLDGGEVKAEDIDGKGEQSEVHLTPKLVESTNTQQIENAQGVHDRALSSIEQAVILARCLDIKVSNPEDELRSWQMAPYIEAVDDQQRSPEMVKALCQLLRVRWEKTRTRTRERGFLMMEQLTDRIRKGDCEVSKRMLYAFCVPFSIFPALLKEYAEMMVSFGLVGDALRLFEELEMWNNLIDCYCLLGKKAAAADLIRERLKVQPKDPRLWCSLGDVTMDDDCYLKAWEFSGHHFARAQRSLARTAYHKHNYVKAIEHWDLALSLNPLHPDGWFGLGSAAIKAKKLDKAIHAFTRQVQLDPENSESWNNIAAIHMQRRRSKEAFAAFREALKLKRNSWQIWENFAQVALDVANFNQAILALERVLDLSEDKRVDITSYTRLVEDLEVRKGLRERQKPNCAPDSEQSMESSLDGEDEFESFAFLSLPLPTKTSREGAALAGDIDALAMSEGSDNHLAQNKETEMLVEKTGKLLSRIVSKGQGGGEVWGLKARWHRIMGDMTMCVEALLKQVRAYQGSRWQNSQEQFRIFARVCHQLCEAYIEVAASGSGKREVSSAQMLLRNTIKQAEPYRDTQHYKDLEQCLLQVERVMEGS